MMAEVWERRRIAIRGLGEHAHYAVRSGGTSSARAGWSAGPATTFALMRDDQTVLVFPWWGAGGQQAARPAVPAALGWRMGFARTDRARLPDRPCARRSGAGDMFDVIPDQTTPLYGQLALAYEEIMGFPTPPVVRGVGLTPIHVPNVCTSGSESPSTPL